MTMLRSIVLAFAMFSRLPMPRVEWKPENMRYMLAALPLVGCVAGLLLRCWAWLAGLWSFGPLLLAAGMTLLPMALSGGVHLDGFCDTVDALASQAPPEGKRAILKDPHSGAFAIIWLAAYFLAMAALWSELPLNSRCLGLAGLIPVLSRIVSGLAGLCFPGSSEPSSLGQFRLAAEKRPALLILIAWALLCSGAMLWLDWRIGGVMLLLATACGAYVYFMSRRQFAGMSGDIAGYLLQITELALLAGLIFMDKAVS